MRIISFLIIILGLSICRVSAEDTLELEKFKPPKFGFWENVLNVFIPHFEKSNIVYEKESKYFFITVEDSERGTRSLVFKPKKGSQSTIRFDTPNAVLPKFMQYAFLALTTIDKTPEKVLFIGLGAGIMPMFLRRLYPQVNIDIVELDPAIEPIAKKYFGFKPDLKMKVIVKDGRVFINNSNQRYDLIFIDAYNAKEIPFQLTTLEFFKHIKKCLTPDGVMVANIANFGDMGFIFNEFKTINHIFANIAVFLCSGQTNFVLLASEKNLLSETKMQTTSKILDGKYNWNFKITPFLSTRLTKRYLKTNTKNALLITDDFTPQNK